MQSHHDSSDSGPKLVNRLHLSKSPYVRAHMNNPVAWQLWDSEAINHAKKYNRMIFLSIGYSACHWCHVMEKESFMSSEVATILNESFIPIKVDREERPDIDDIYMNYVQATTRVGWLASKRLSHSRARARFRWNILAGAQFGYLTRTGHHRLRRDLGEAERCLENTTRTLPRERQGYYDATARIRRGRTHSQSTGQEGEEEDLDIELLEEAYQHFATRYDSINGGFGRAPKFPTPANLAFLLRLGAYPAEVQDVVGQDECEKATAMAVTTLVNMARGGIRDHIGHGFSRYSVTADWSLPHFEKMLYDQAQLLDVYLDAFRLTHDPELLGAVYDLAAYLTTAPMQSPTGGFYSSEDADSYPSPNETEKREGAFYVWSLKELNQVLGSRDAPVCARHWGVLPDGNVAAEYDPHDEFMNQNVLSVKATPSKLAKDFGLSEEEVVRIIKNGKQKLRDHREKARGHPDLDDKIVVAWNGLAIGALAKCSVLFGEIESSKATSCREAAARAIGFIKDNLFERSTGKLWRIWRDGSRGDTPGFADDYAYLTSGLLDMYEATFDDSYLQFAERLQKYLNEHFLSKTETSSSGYFNTSSEPTPGMPGPLFRLKTGTESATPSVNAIIARNLLRLAALLEEDQYRTLARQTCNSFAVEILQHPFLFVGLLDVVVGLQIGTRIVTGVFCTTETTFPSSAQQGVSSSGQEDQEDQPVVARDLIMQRVRAEAGAGLCPTLAAASMVDVRPSHLKDFVGNQSFWLKSRNPLFKDLKAGEPAKNHLMVCETGRCRTIDL
ncbi:hypothetical protein POX_c04095 [Penicillium oxalicum]|uniref:hypothetical protein n=1 Tax=Penicillium oxalicum TaxID=69781 RepID=UPI0020B7EBB3|nr:hypothetical protein POX_c04095 [Penicillium oxalicum]KAI2791238.1 hypothetical protein POX_c04095 [Penicillium oxalicum]